MKSPEYGGYDLKILENMREERRQIKFHIPADAAFNAMTALIRKKTLPKGERAELEFGILAKFSNIIPFGPHPGFEYYKGGLDSTVPISFDYFEVEDLGLVALSTSSADYSPSSQEQKSIYQEATVSRNNALDAYLTIQEYFVIAGGKRDDVLRHAVKFERMKDAAA